MPVFAAIANFAWPGRLFRGHRLAPWCGFRHRGFVLASIAAIGLALGSPARAPAQQVAVDPNTAIVESWEGWGCSLSWWGVYSRSWSRERRAQLCRLLFSRDPDALGWNVCRYNAGGTSPTADTTRYRAGADVRVILDADGSWHPERDQAQIDCLKEAIRLGADRLELFVNSPPYWMLKNGSTMGREGGKENLRADCRSAYAEWLADLLNAFRTKEHISFDYVAPFNEPSAWWWKPDSGSQEGCKIDWPTQAVVVRALRKELAARGLAVRIAASDENGAEQGYNTLKWLMAPAEGGAGGGLTPADLPKLNVHAYNGWNWQERLRNLAGERRVPKIWMSEVTFREWAPAGFAPDDMRCALPISRSIVSDIRGLHCSAWVFWQPIEPLQQDLRNNYTYGLIPTSLDSDVVWRGQTYHPGEGVRAKSYYAVRQFSAFIRPGDRLVAAGDAWTVAAFSPKESRLTLVIHNDSKQERAYTFDLTRFLGSPKSARRWRTQDDKPGDAYDCREMAPVPISGLRFVDTIPPRSDSTYVITGVRPCP